MATPLLRLAPTWVGDKQGAVQGEVRVLDCGLLNLVGVLLVVRYEALGDSLAGGVGLRHWTSSANSDVELQAREALRADGVDGLEDLSAEGLRQDLVQRDAVDLDVALGRLRHRRDGNRGLLLAEGLDALDHVGRLLGHCQS